LERNALHRCVRVFPADHKYREAMLDEEADETVLGLQVENVELVDPGRNEQQRYRVGPRAERRVLDQLDEAVSVDDLPLRDGEVLSWRESFGVGHSHPTL